MIPEHFKAGELVKASDWNKVAREVNRIWGMEVDAANFELVKGEPWRLRFIGETSADWYPANQPIWEIYVYRPTATYDWQIEQAPAAVFLTGPFTMIRSRTVRRIAKLIKHATTTGTRLDRTFSTNCGFVITPADYYQQKISKVPATGDLLVSGGYGFADTSGNLGLFYALNWETGATQFAPYANIEALVSNIIGNAVAGMASYGDTIALVIGDNALAVGTDYRIGATLFDTAGTPVEVAPGSYLHEFTPAGTAGGTKTQWTVAYDGGYLAQENSVFPSTAPVLHKFQADAVSGISNDAAWDVNGGTGGFSAWRPRINSGMDGLYLSLADSGWAGSTPTALLTSLNTDGSISQLNEPGLPSDPNILELKPFDYFTAIAAIVFGVGQGTVLADYYQFFIRTFNGTSYDLVTVDGFNGAVVDVKFFRTKDDGITHQFIIVGEFTEWDGADAQYIAFCDQSGNRLTDLEWP